MSNKLKENQIIATQKVAMGLTNRQIAKELNVAEETICRWKQTPEFQAAVNHLLVEQRNAAQQRLRKIINLSLDVVETHLSNKTISSEAKVSLSLKLLQMCNTRSLFHEKIESADEEIIQKQIEEKEFNKRLNLF